MKPKFPALALHLVAATLIFLSPASSQTSQAQDTTPSVSTTTLLPDTPTRSVVGTGAPTGTTSDSSAGATQNGAWSVQGPTSGRWVLKTGQEFDFTVTAGDQPLRNLALTGSTLQNTETGVRLGVGRLQLCRVDGSSGARDSAQKCVAAGEIKAKQSATFALRLDPKAVPAGIYTGSASFAASGGEGLKSLELRVEHTSGGRWLLGALAIALGVVLAWLLTVFLRQWSARGTATFPAARLRDTLKELRTQVDSASEITGVKFSGLPRQLEDRDQALEYTALEANGLPPLIPNPFAAATDGVAAYQKYIDTQALKVTALAVIVRVGVGEALAAWAETEEKTPIVKALKSLDVAAATHQDPATAETHVRLILDTMHSEISKKLLDDAPSRENRTTPSTHDVQVQLQHISLAAWGLSFVVTVLAGLVVLVVTNYGFGTVMDYMKCVFWGLGLPIAGQQLQQLTPGDVRTSLRVTLPS